MVEEEDVLKAVERNLQGSRPKELFEDVLEEVEEQYLKDRATLRAANVYEIKAGSTLKDFLGALDAAEETGLKDISFAFR